MELTQSSELTLECLAIGSLPHTNPKSAIQTVKDYFSNIPFWPQLVKYNKKEDMLIQYLDNMPSFFIEEETGNVVLECESEKFFEDIENFFTDWEIITENIFCEEIEKYGISQEYSSTFNLFLELVKELKPAYAKGQIVGPFTLATTLCDKNQRCAIYDETLKEIIIKNLAIKAFWQIKQIKLSNPDTTPIIFIDEPSISQLGTSAYLTISEDEVVEMLSYIVELIRANGGLAAIHCCGKCDWRVPIRAKVDIINLDAFAFAQNLSLFHKEISEFLNLNGKIAFGIIPTLDVEALQSHNIEDFIEIFKNAVNYLTKKGIDEKIIIQNSLVTPSCGAGSLDEENAKRAMSLTYELSQRLKEMYLKR